MKNVVEDELEFLNDTASTNKSSEHPWPYLGKFVVLAGAGSDKVFYVSVVVVEPEWDDS